MSKRSADEAFTPMDEKMQEFIQIVTDIMDLQLPFGIIVDTFNVYQCDVGKYKLIPCPKGNPLPLDIHRAAFKYRHL